MGRTKKMGGVGWKGTLLKGGEGTPQRRSRGDARRRQGRSGRRVGGRGLTHWEGIRQYHSLPASRSGLGSPAAHGRGLHSLVVEKRIQP